MQASLNQWLVAATPNLPDNTAAHGCGRGRDMDNTNGNHVALARWIDGAGGQSRFEDTIIPYTRTHGPLSQTAVIEAAAIRFHCWPSDFAGIFKLASERILLLAMDGAARITAGGGEVRTFRPPDVLELTGRTDTEVPMEAAQGRPFRAAVIVLGRSHNITDNTPSSPASQQSLPYLRNVTGGDGCSHFEDGAWPYHGESGNGVATEGIALSGIQYVHASGDLSYDFHNAPQRQIVLPLTGGVSVENGDGGRREVPPGGVFIGEDTTGQGHITRAVNGEIRFSLFAHLVT
jgi:hypothetical protein